MLGRAPAGPVDDLRDDRAEREPARRGGPPRRWNTIADHREYYLVPLLHDTQLQQHARECHGSGGARVADHPEPRNPLARADVSRLRRNQTFSWCPPGLEGEGTSLGVVISLAHRPSEASSGAHTLPRGLLGELVRGGGPRERTPRFSTRTGPLPFARARRKFNARSTGPPRTGRRGHRLSTAMPRSHVRGLTFSLLAGPGM
jgi:hypothetical protein